jgi:hypothetical protein
MAEITPAQVHDLPTGTHEFIASNKAASDARDVLGHLFLDVARTAKVGLLDLSAVSGLHHDPRYDPTRHRPRPARRLRTTRTAYLGRPFGYPSRVAGAEASQPCLPSIPISFGRFTVGVRHVALVSTEHRSQAVFECRWSGLMLTVEADSQ